MIPVVPSARRQKAQLKWTRNIPLDQVQHARLCQATVQGQNQNPVQFHRGVEIVFRSGSYVLPTGHELESNWLICEINEFLENVAYERQAMPPKPMIDREGVAKRNNSGKTEYALVLEFEGRAVRDAFSAAVARALLAFDLHAFETAEEAVP